MKQPIAIHITDTHLGENTVHQNLATFNQVFELCHTLGVNKILHGGDIFTSRKGQPEIVLNTWKEIIDTCARKELCIYAIGGNHDKVSYTSEESVLDAFDNHPGFKVMRCGDAMLIGKVNLLFLPYFDEQLTYPEKLQQVPSIVGQDGLNILITHVGIDGVSNNGGRKVQNEISQQGFDKFDLVLIGHYHNRQVLSDKIIYTGSTDPRNFGEDNKKGVTVIYDDGSYEFIQLDFKPYLTIDVLPKDIDQVLVSKVQDKLQEANIRLNIIGEVEESKKQLLIELQSSGAKYEINKSDYNPLEQVSQTQVSFTDSDIVDLYDQWGKLKSIEDVEYGKQLLTSTI